MITAVRAEIFTPAECAEIRAKIFDLKLYWVQRHSRGAYFTLGASNYWDFVLKSQKEYRDEAHRLNRVLMDHFGELYERLKTLFSERVKVPVVYDPDLALPGFHVFIGDEVLAQTQDVMHDRWFEERSNPNKFANSIHCDTPHLHLDFGDRPVDKTDALSFTGAIALPAKGSGLYVWDMMLHEGLRIPVNELQAELQKREKLYHEYGVGEIFVHPGMAYHQIAKLENVVPGEERITLQGHASRRLTGEWVLYW